MRSLDDVGVRKAVGYLPLDTVKNLLKEDVRLLKARYEAAGLTVKIFGAGKCCIHNGAFFVYDRALVAQAVERFEIQISEKGWSDDPAYIIDEIASRWFEKDDRIFDLIATLYHDPA